jgi:hypothetical protein
MLTSHRSLQAFILSGFAVFLFTVLTARGSTYYAASAKGSDVQAKIDLAHDGDTILVPAGTARWTTQLNITKNLTLKGAGIGQTVIFDEGPRAPQSHTMSVVLTKDLPFRVTGFEFRGDSSVTKPNGGGIFYFRGMEGMTGRFRLDHCKFTGLQGLPLVFRDLIGVIDHCAVDTVDTQGAQVYHFSWGGGNFGHGSWADYPYWGSDKFLFFEDCTFTNSGTDRAAIDCYEGARVVVRYSTFNDAQISAHGTEGQGRGAKQLEIYNNVFTVSSPRGGAQVRSGAVLVHDNVYNNFTRGIDLKAYRQVVRRGSWGISSGSNVWDVNNSVMAALERGTHTGADSARTLIDSNKNWNPGQWETVVSRKGFSYVLRNITQNRQSVIMSNTSRSLSYFLYAPPMTFNRGDTYEIWKVVTTLDQPGQGKSDLLSGLPALPKRWPHNVVEPCYSWNNKDPHGNEVDLHTVEGSIQEGSDYYNRTRKPNYAPYVYPHPLTASN